MSYDKDANAVVFYYKWWYTIKVVTMIKNETKLKEKL